MNSLLYNKYHDCRRRTAVLVFFCVFSGAIFSLKVSSSSAVYATIETGSSPLVAAEALLNLSLVSVVSLSSAIFSFAIDCCQFHVLVSVSDFLENISRKSFSSLRSSFCFVNGDKGFENIIVSNFVCVAMRGYAFLWWNIGQPRF